MKTIANWLAKLWYWITNKPLPEPKGGGGPTPPPKR